MNMKNHDIFEFFVRSSIKCVFFNIHAPKTFYGYDLTSRPYKARPPFFDRKKTIDSYALSYSSILSRYLLRLTIIIPANLTRLSARTIHASIQQPTSDQSTKRPFLRISSEKYPRPSWQKFRKALLIDRRYRSDVTTSVELRWVNECNFFIILMIHLCFVKQSNGAQARTGCFGGKWICDEEGNV